MMQEKDNYIYIKQSQMWKCGKLSFVNAYWLKIIDAVPIVL